MNARYPKSSLVLFAGLLLLANCRQKDQPLQLADLTVGEHLYVARIVAVERAKSVALVHPGVGAALLDSLRTTWGDSLESDTLAGLSDNPNRSVGLGKLLLRVLKAEQDSLLWDPGASRLHLPLPDPNRPGRVRIPNSQPTAEAAVPRN